MYIPSRREREIANNAFIAGVVARRLDDGGMLKIIDELDDVSETIVALSTSYKRDPDKPESEQLREFVSYVGDELLCRYGALA